MPGDRIFFRTAEGQKRPKTAYQGAIIVVGLGYGALDGSGKRDAMRLMSWHVTWRALVLVGLL